MDCYCNELQQLNNELNYDIDRISEKIQELDGKSLSSENEFFSSLRAIKDFQLCKSDKMDEIAAIKVELEKQQKDIKISRTKLSLAKESLGQMVECAREASFRRKLASQELGRLKFAMKRYKTMEHKYINKKEKIIKKFGAVKNCGHKAQMGEEGTSNE